MRSFTRFVAWVAVIGGAIATLLYLFVFDTWLVPGDDPQFTVGVLPTLAPEDRILIKREAMPIYGQLARCANPMAPGRWVVGRVFGLHGDTVYLHQGAVTVNNQVVSPRHGCKPMNVTNPATGQMVSLNCGVEENGSWSYETLRTGELVEADVAVKVAEGKLFLVSDNRHLHQDSRDFGMVDAAGCEHIVYRLWGATYLDSSRRNNVLW